MDAKVEQILAEYDERAVAERKLWGQSNRDDLLLRVGPETGQLLNILAKGAGARSFLELGTSYGYSTVWLAEAARETNGRVITIDVAAKKQDYARDMLERAGLVDFVEFRVGDALQVLRELEAPFDFVLVDLWKDLYTACFDLFYPKLAPGALIIADNMLRPESARTDAQVYRANARAHKGIESVLLSVGSGIELSRYAPAGR
jgi:predicted O-methyltransferase YrrM